MDQPRPLPWSIRRSCAMLQLRWTDLFYFQDSVSGSDSIGYRDMETSPTHGSKSTTATSSSSGTPFSMQGSGADLIHYYAAAASSTRGSGSTMATPATFGSNTLTSSTSTTPSSTQGSGSNSIGYQDTAKLPTQGSGSTSTSSQHGADGKDLNGNTTASKLETSSPTQCSGSGTLTSSTPRTPSCSQGSGSDSIGYHDKAASPTQGSGLLRRRPLP